MSTDETGLPPDVLTAFEQIERAFDQDMITTPSQRAQVWKYIRGWAVTMGCEEALLKVADKAATILLKSMGIDEPPGLSNERGAQDEYHDAQVQRQKEPL